jgi:hypothetical protein
MFVRRYTLRNARPHRGLNQPQRSGYDSSGRSMLRVCLRVSLVGTHRSAISVSRNVLSFRDTILLCRSSRSVPGLSLRQPASMISPAEPRSIQQRISLTDGLVQRTSAMQRLGSLFAPIKEAGHVKAIGDEDSLRGHSAQRACLAFLEVGSCTLARVRDPAHLLSNSQQPFAIICRKMKRTTARRPDSKNAQGSAAPYSAAGPTGTILSNSCRARAAEGAVAPCVRDRDGPSSQRRRRGSHPAQQ